MKTYQKPEFPSGDCSVLSAAISVGDKAPEGSRARNLYLAFTAINNAANTFDETYRVFVSQPGVQDQEVLDFFTTERKAFEDKINNLTNALASLATVDDYDSPGLIEIDGVAHYLRHDEYMEAWRKMHAPQATSPAASELLEVNGEAKYFRHAEYKATLKQLFTPNTR